jgi:hypothetical protein
MSVFALRRPVRAATILGAVVTALLYSPSAGVAQRADRSDWESQVRTYRLTMDKVARTAKVNDLLYTAMKKDPSLAKRWEDQGSPLDNSSTVDEASRRLAADPAAHRALTAAGISGRDYALTLMAFIQASLTVGLQDSKQISNLPDGVSPDNIAFVRTHRGELEKFKGSFNPERDPGADGESRDSASSDN